MNLARRLLRENLSGPEPASAPADPTELRRRRVVVVVTLVVGAVLVGISLHVPAGGAQFLVSALGLAAVWTVGGLLSGPLHLGTGGGGTGGGGTAGGRRSWLGPLGIGIALGAVFLAGALIVREIPSLRDYVTSVLSYATGGPLLPVAVVTAANGVAEEIFFRGALFAAIEAAHRVTLTTAVYALTTIATGNPMLVFAAVAVGTVLAQQRRATGGILAPAITHVTWSMLMLFALPPLL